MSLRYRIALLVFVLEAAMIAVMLWQIERRDDAAIEAHLAASDQALFTLLHAPAVQALREARYESLQAQLQQLQQLPQGSQLRQAWLADASGRVVAASNPALLGQPPPPLADDETVYWRSRRLDAAGQTRGGQLALQFSRELLQRAVQEARTRAIVVALAGMLLIALAGILLGVLLSRRLARLTHAAERLAGGENGVRSGIGGHDELGRLGRAFDRMAQTVEGSLAALRASEERNRVLVEHGPAGIFVFDAEAFRLVDSNQRMVDMLGYPRERLIGMTPIDVSPPQQKGGRATDDLARELVQRTLAGEHPMAEWMLRRADGSDLPCELQLSRYPAAERKLLIGVIYSVSERERIAQALARRLQFEDLIVRLSARFIGLHPEEIDRGIRLALAEIGRFAGVDRSYVFQFSEDLATESCTHEWCAPGIAPAIQRLQTLPLEDYPWFMARVPCGEVIHVPRVSELPPEAERERAEFEAESIRSVIMVPLAFEGRVIGYLGLDSVRQEQTWPTEIVVLLKIVGEILFNALHRKHSEQALREQARTMVQMNQRLQQSNSELQQFAYVASHDLQEPMRAISGFSTLLQRSYRGRLDAEADEYLDFIAGAARRMQTMISDLLEYSRLETRAQPFVPVDTAEVLRQALENLRLAIGDSGAMVTQAELPRLQADPGQLLLLFQNLVGNAIKFRGAQPPRIEIAAVADGGNWHFSVRDNGIGMPESALGQVFMMFKRLHSVEDYPGTGIGLAVCRRIVERHGGKIWAESAPGKGSVFHFTLSAVPPPAA